jgi:hypothetical protein
MGDDVGDNTDIGNGENQDGALKRRDRLDFPHCEGEPVNPDPAYQLILAQAYGLKNSGRILEVYDLLMQHAHLPKLPLQQVRTECLFAEYFTALEQQLDAQGVPERERTHDFFGQAADHFARAAVLAENIPDLALSAQLKARESKTCYFSDPRRKRYRRAFAAAQRALKVWQDLADRKIATDLEYGFKLGDLLGLCAGMVAEEGEAVRGLDYAAFCLLDLQHLPGADPAQYANDELFLDWDWTYLLFTTGHYRQAFKKALQTRKKGRDLFTTKNRARFQAHIAGIMLACAEEGQVGDRSRTRLLVASDNAIFEAYEWVEICKKIGEEDHAAYALILLADAKYMGLAGKVKGRLAKIEEAQRIAAALDDILLLGRVEISWGDEYALQYARRPTKRLKERVELHYRKAIEMLEEVEAFSLALTAHKRLEQFRNPPPLSVEPQKDSGNPPPRGPKVPSPDFDPSLN